MRAVEYLVILIRVLQPLLKLTQLSKMKNPTPSAQFRLGTKLEAIRARGPIKNLPWHQLSKLRKN